MPTPSASYAITMRLHIDIDDHAAIGRVTTAVAEHRGMVAALDFVEATGVRQTVDVTVNAAGGEHASTIQDAVDALDGVTVHRVSDRTFLLHLGGKLEVNPTVSLRSRDDMSMAYTPGVARVCRQIAERPEDASRLTIKGNTVAIVTDGSAVLGLGDIGPTAALPVMEGKAALFKAFAGIDAWPVCLDTTDPDEIVRIVEAMAPVYGGVNLEDIAAPRCFEVEERLRASLDIPVFHDDQHGTAIVVLAALRNALRVVDKPMGDARVTLVGAGAAGAAITRLLLAEGVGDVVVVDREGILHDPEAEPDGSRRWLAEHTNRDRRHGDVLDALDGADVFIGVSGPDLFDASELRRMNDDGIVFALANPDPEVDPVAAREHVAVVATGRSDNPNQINNVLAFPGIFRGALDARARAITEEMKVAAAHAIADVVDDLHPSLIIPSVFDTRVVPAVAAAVQDAAATAAGATADDAGETTEATEEPAR